VSEGRWRITVTAPDWGEDHLTLDAVVAYVDDELGPGPYGRASRHVANCDECRAQVAAQRQARAALRTAGGPRLPSSLLSALRSIPEHADLPAAPADLAVSPDGQLVYRPDPPTRPTRRPREAAPEHGLRSPSAALPPAPVAPEASTDLLDPPTVDTAIPDAGPGDDTAEQTRRVPRRIRFGTGVAVSGLALGALAFGATAASPTAPAPATERGVLGGPVLGGSTGGSGSLLSPSGLVDARLRLGASRLDPGRSGLRELPGGPGSLRGLW
jgi:anti-sigma factor RsiW